ncbi:MAG TPA: hypothetical protein VGC55_02190 [Dokdonella sp.]
MSAASRDGGVDSGRTPRRMPAAAARRVDRAAGNEAVIAASFATAHASRCRYVQAGSTPCRRIRRRIEHGNPAARLASAARRHPGHLQPQFDAHAANRRAPFFAVRSSTVQSAYPRAAARAFRGLTYFCQISITLSNKFDISKFDDDGFLILDVAFDPLHGA